MTIETLFALIAQFRTPILISIGVFPVVVFVLGLVHGVYDGRRPPWVHYYSLLLNFNTLITFSILAFAAYEGYFGAGRRSPTVVLFALFGGWLLTVLFIRRVVELRRLAVGPGLWYAVAAVLLGWTAAAFAYQQRYDLLIGVERTALAAALATFVVLRIVGRFLRRREA